MALWRSGLAGLALAVACTGRNAPQTSTSRRDVITRDELQNSIHADLDVLQAIRTLRPQFLARPPGIQRASAPREILIYVDGVRQPIGAEALRSIRASSVDEVRYLEPTAAANELGPLAAGGALLLKLRATQRTQATPPL